MSNSTTTLPSYIDTAGCLCALEASRGSLDNGNQLWRCLGNVTADITIGSSGKWFPTQQSESSLAGLGDEPQDWAGYPPNLSTPYVLIQGGLGNLNYVPLAQANPGTLSPQDAKCTGKNNTRASGVFYTQGAAAAASSYAPSSGSSTSKKKNLGLLGCFLLLAVASSAL